jgi:hypothetical protein
MKRALLILTFILIIFPMAMNSAALEPAATIEWNNISIDLGDIPIHKPVKVDFVFKNPGMIPIIIREVKPSCGCTVAEFSKQPILSGTEGKITVTYDAEESGYFSKTISVFSNTPEKETQ